MVKLGIVAVLPYFRKRRIQLFLLLYFDALFPRFNSRVFHKVLFSGPFPCLRPGPSISIRLDSVVTIEDNTALLFKRHHFVRMNLAKATETASWEHGAANSKGNLRNPRCCQRILWCGRQRMGTPLKIPWEMRLNFPLNSVHGSLNEKLYTRWEDLVYYT